jgi:hypothetical protein
VTPARDDGAERVPGRAAAAHDVGTEARRALIATGLGVALGLLAALFAKRDPKTGPRRRVWRGKSAT